MLKPVSFQPQNFGGYTLSMLLSGMFLGYTTSKAWYFIIASTVIFLIGCWFYAKDNQEDKE